MSRYVDPRAPTDLGSEEINTLKADPGIVQLREIRDRLSYENPEESGTLKKAEARETKVYQMYKTSDRELRCAKAKMLKSAKEVAQQQFFDTINTIEINRQLDLSLLDLNKDDWKPKRLEHNLEERKIIVDLICKNTYGMSGQDKPGHRIRTVNALVALCHEDTPLQHRLDRTWGILHRNESPESPPFPKTCTQMHRIFCFRNPREPSDVRLRHFSTVYKARYHVELHLERFKTYGDIPCPDSDCQGAVVVLHGHMRFMNHATYVRNYDIFRKPY